MTPHEFKSWLRDHARLFPGVTKWLKDNGQEKVWYSTLSGMSASLARDASQRLYEEPEQIGYTKHPAKVLEYANAANARSYNTAAPQPRVVDGEAVYTCYDCEDTGMVSVYRNETIRCELGEARKFNGRMTRVPYRCAVKCHCAYGQTLPGQHTYDPERMCKVLPDGPEQRKQAVRGWIEQYKPPNHDPAFDDWNEAAETEGAYFL